MQPSDNSSLPSSSSERDVFSPSATDKVSKGGKKTTFELSNITIHHQQHNTNLEASPVRLPKPVFAHDEEYSDEEETTLERGKAAEHQSLLKGEDERESLGITNLDVFFQQVYTYFNEKGFWCLLVERLLRLCSVFFMMVFSTFLFVFLDWAAMWHCQDVQCKKIPIIRDDVWTLNAFHVIVLLFELVVFFYWFSLVVKYGKDVLSMIAIKNFYNYDLNISEQDIQTIQWNEVVEKIIELQHKRKIYIVKNIDEFDILNRIMRKENYLISLINKEIMNLKIPFFQRTYLSESLIYNLRLMVDSMFDSDFKINQSFVNSSSLSLYFVKLGIINLLLAPFLLIYFLLYTSFKYLAELKNNPKQVLGRRWSLYAHFKFREYHELSHEFERKLNQAYGLATEYLNQFPNIFLSIVAHRIMFFISALAGVIIVLSYLNNSLTIYFTVFNQNLLTWLTTLLFAWAYVKGFVIDEHAVFNPKQKLDEICETLHHHDLSWKGKGHHQSVRNAFLSYFIPSYQYFLNEIFSVFITPLILIISLPKSADNIVKFIEKVTVDYEGLGDVCGHAAFKFNQFGNNMYGSNTNTDNKQVASEFGKMEISYLSFLQKYPNYKPKEDNGEMEFIKAVEKSYCGIQTSETATSQNPPQKIETPPPSTPTFRTHLQVPRQPLNLSQQIHSHYDNPLTQSRMLFNMLESTLEQ
ncbi:hypothetical protein FDP41_009272 [Naegleria fowleri]|uniref:Autophagy-related protein 9 n=1 Tax=Naegleria fowleri TaxID=5763 RepID=A0A6A5BH72_NAEFO|nr:uncharacterized protein FDP41_009272 [Naegleria fowleri]KAF0972369.1 hypothetical protein FDP41_009272 [Naegleria fowleri]CAG4714978.1 unnamed protein product [Naegleria fowleri]